MGLLALCLVAVLSPQEPVPSPPRPAIASVPTAPDDAADLAALAKAEADKAQADPTELARLTESTNAKIAARAAFLLAERKDRPAYEPMRIVARRSPHAEARALAMAGISRIADVGSTATAIDALTDDDRRVRTFAAQLLGKLKRPTAIDPLLAVIERSRTTTAVGPATDLQACLLALHDFGAHDKVLRAAMALHDGKAEGTGPALAFCCQGLLGKMAPADQTTFLLAILAHRESVVRRFAIAELAARQDPNTASALESRLAIEGDELRPLVEVALARVRNDRSSPPSDEVERAKNNLQAIVAKVSLGWQQLSTAQQGLAAGVPVLRLAFAIWLRRHRRASAAAAVAADTAAMVQPSEEFAAELADEANAAAQEVDELTLATDDTSTMVTDDAEVPDETAAAR